MLIANAAQGCFFGPTRTGRWNIKKEKRKIVLRVDKTAATAISTEMMMMMMMMMRQWKWRLPDTHIATETAFERGVESWAVAPFKHSLVHRIYSLPQSNVLSVAKEGGTPSKRQQNRSNLEPACTNWLTKKKEKPSITICCTLHPKMRTLVGAISRKWRLSSLILSPIKRHC